MRLSSPWSYSFFSYFCLIPLIFYSVTCFDPVHSGLISADPNRTAGITLWRVRWYEIQTQRFNPKLQVWRPTLRTCPETLGFIPLIYSHHDLAFCVIYQDFRCGGKEISLWGGDRRFSLRQGTGGPSPPPPPQWDLTLSFTELSLRARSFLSYSPDLCLWPFMVESGLALMGRNHRLLLLCSSLFSYLK